MSPIEQGYEERLGRLAETNRALLRDNQLKDAFIAWIGTQDVTNPRVSAIIRNKIIPDIVQKNILI